MLLFLIFLLNPPFCYTLGKQGVQSLFSQKLSSSSQSKILGFGGLEEGGGAVLYFRIVPDVRKLSITAVRAARESLYFSETDRILAASSLIFPNSVPHDSASLWVVSLKGQQLSTTT